MEEATDRDPKKMYLTSNDVITLFIIYLIAMVVGLYIVVMAILSDIDPAAKANGAITYCICMSMVGTSVFYVRKLYKAAINDTYTFSTVSEDGKKEAVRLRRAGTLAFFIFRPLFGIAFSVVVYSLWRLSLSASGSADAKLTEGFLYTTLSLGFISGFLAGRLLTMFEGYGTRRLAGMMGTDA